MPSRYSSTRYGRSPLRRVEVADVEQLARRAASSSRISTRASRAKRSSTVLVPRHSGSSTLIATRSPAASCASNTAPTPPRPSSRDERPAPADDACPGATASCVGGRRRAPCRASRSRRSAELARDLLRRGAAATSSWRARERARRAIGDRQRADRRALVDQQRHARVEAKVRLAGDQRVVGEARVERACPRRRTAGGR